MQFTVLATLVAAAVTVGAARLDARQASACVQPQFCSLAPSTTVLGSPVALPAVTTACCAGTTCGDPVPTTLSADGNTVEADIAVCCLFIIHSRYFY